MIVHIIATVLTAGIFILFALLLLAAIVLAYRGVRMLLRSDLGDRHRHAKKVAGFQADPDGAVTGL